MEDISYLLRAAAAPALDRIRRDREHAPYELAAALDHVAGHLFSHQLDVSHLRRATRIAGRHLHLLFREHLDTTPRDYIEERRLTIGSRLLVDTALPVGQIGEMLGYSSAAVFSRAFTRSQGERPTLFRQNARRDAARQTVHRILEALEKRDAESLTIARESLDRSVELARELGDRGLYTRLLVARAALAGPIGKVRPVRLLEQVRGLVG